MLVAWTEAFTCLAISVSVHVDTGDELVDIGCISKRSDLSRYQMIPVLDRLIQDPLTESIFDACRLRLRSYSDPDRFLGNLTFEDTHKQSSIASANSQ